MRSVVTSDMSCLMTADTCCLGTTDMCCLETAGMCCLRQRMGAALRQQTCALCVAGRMLHSLPRTSVEIFPLFALSQVRFLWDFCC